MPVHKNKEWVYQVLVGGLFLLLCPPLGWMLAMGYRKAFGRAYVNNIKFNSNEIFKWPKWENLWPMLIDGIKVWSVIITYLSPSFIFGWGIILFRSGFGQEQCFALSLFIIACVLILPLGLPVVIFVLYNHYAWFTFSLFETIIISTIFILGVFFVPSGFVLVSLGKDFKHALPFGDGLKFVIRKPFQYCKAWCYALICCFGVLLLGPLAPFGIFWSYQISAKMFIDVVVDDEKYF